MMFVLTDDLELATFDSPENPPNWIEWIDVANGVYSFSDDGGQLYEGQLLQKGGLFKAEQWHLVPYGDSNIKNAISLAERAVYMEPGRSTFPDLASVKAHLTSAPTSPPAPPTLNDPPPNSAINFVI